MGASEGYRQMGMQVGRILKNAMTNDRRIQQSTKINLVINLKTAMASLYRPSLLARADEAIE